MELVVMQNQQAVTSSLQVAGVFEKQHKDVLEAIDNKIQSAENSAHYKLMFQATEEIQADVQGVKGRVIELEENQSIKPGDYGYISRRIHQRVAEVARGYGKITQKQRGELYKDINGGIKKVTGVGSRTQLRDKHYQTVVDFINDWEPSTATKTIVRQINFLEE